MDDLTLMRDMTDTQRLLFQTEVSKHHKNRATALLLTLFLGGLGAHRFYMGQVGRGLLYVLFCWTFIPLVISFIELFLVMGRVDRYNEAKSAEVALKIKVLAGAPA